MALISPQCAVRAVIVALFLLSSTLLASAAQPRRSRAAQGSQQLLAGILDGYQQQRQAIVKRETRARAVQMARSRQVLRRLARQPPLKLPKVRPSAKPKYVDLSGQLALVPAMPTIADFNPTYSNYPRYPSIPLPAPLVPLASCPDLNSIRSFGGRGNGRADETAAFQAAIASDVEYIYLPTGEYRIPTDLTITKPIVAAANAWFEIGANATLTLTAQPRKIDSSNALFGGVGKRPGGGRKSVRVKLTAPNVQVSPDWFKNGGDGDAEALQQAIDACESSCTILLTRNYFLSKAVMLRPEIEIFSTNVNVVVNGTGEGFVLTPGFYDRPLMFGNFIGCGSFCIKVKGGVTGAELQINGGYDLQDLVVLAPDENGGISNVFLTHLSATSGAQNTIAFRATSTSQEIRNCLLRGNFILKGGFWKPLEQSATFAILGPAAPRLIGTMVQWQAVDTVQFENDTSHVWLQNAAATPAGNVVFNVQSWGGGMDIRRFGRMIAGEFRGLKARMDTAGGIPTADHMMILSGYGNLVTYGGVDTAAREWIMPEGTPSKSDFWCPGCCMKANRTECTDMDYLRGLTTTPQVFFVNAPIDRPWPPREIRTFYLWNVYAQTADNRIGCVPFRAGNAGIVCHGFDNQQSQDPGRISIQLRNAAAYNVTQPSYRFGIQIGP